jgi:hypothetical protein
MDKVSRYAQLALGLVEYGLGFAIVFTHLALLAARGERLPN